MHCHMHASFTSGCAFVYFTVKYSNTVPLFQAQNVQKQHKSVKAAEI